MADKEWDFIKKNKKIMKYMTTIFREEFVKVQPNSITFYSLILAFSYYNQWEKEEKNKNYAILLI